MTPVTTIKNRAHQLAQSGDLQGAIGDFRKALKIDSNDPDTHYKLGMLLGRSNNLIGAIEHLRTANALAPGNAHILQGLGSALFASKQYDEAISYLQDTVKVAPRQYAAHLYLGNIFLLKGSPLQAIPHYETATSIQPGQLDLLINYATACEQTHTTGRAKELLSKALEIDPDHPSTNILLSRLALHSGDYPEAETRLKNILNRTPHPSLAASAFTLLGQVLDKTQQYPEAFSAFVEAGKNRGIIAQSAPCGKGYYSDLIRKNKMLYSPEHVQQWSGNFVQDDIAPPIFFVGFLRSGTTLVEQILGACPGLATTNETPVIDRLIWEREQLPQNEIPLSKNVSTWNEEDIRLLRKRYFELLKETMGPMKSGTRIVDKLALNIVQLGFINRIFPEAKVIVALRDPRDCCLSTFMQEFKLSPATLHFTSLEGTAALYDQAMDLWLHYRNTLKIDYFEYRYEDLVKDAETVCRNIFEHIGEEWDSNALNYHTNSKKRSIATPSYHDVKNPIYTRAVNRWTNYKEQISPLLPLLERYLKEFNYV